MSTTSFDTVRIESGLISGVQGSDSSVKVFKGIPYAASPVGDLRWRAPQPSVAWEGVRRADKFGPISPQIIPVKGSFYHSEFYLKEEIQSEDCLYLNVWTQAKESTERRPVMVWFHGGGLIEGSGSLPSFNGEELAKKGVVVVTVNYRLGVLGFLAHPELSQESEHHVSGNYGLLDQIKSLKWVQQNISAFGGDPSNVTVFGQSAGSFSVFNMVASPIAKGLFHRAIGQSASGYLQPPKGTGFGSKLGDAEQEGVKFAHSLGVQSLQELRAKSVHDLIGSDYQTYNKAFTMRYNIDGWLLPEEPVRIMAQGKQNEVSLLVGATSDEITPMAPDSIRADLFLQEVQELYGEQAEEFLKLYPSDSDNEALKSLIASLNDKFFNAMRAWANQHNKTAKSKAYLYYFDRKLPGRDTTRYGAFHSGELYYVFNTLNSTDRPWGGADRKLTDIMTSYWANFAIKGDPNGEGLPKWPTYEEKDDLIMELGENVGAIAMPNKTKIDFFQRLIENELKH
jgi:para-nitrobenzyl esterase